MTRNDIPDDLFGVSQNPDSEDPYKVLGKLSDENLRKTFSELNDREIKGFARLEYLRQLLEKVYPGNKILDVDTFVETFLVLRMNKDRKSRKEFVQAFGSERTNNIDKMNMQSKQGFVR